MGVCGLLHLSGSREAELSSKLNGVGCVRTRRWRTHCLYLKPKVDGPASEPLLEPPLEEACLLHFSESFHSSHFVVSGGSVRQLNVELGSAEAAMRATHTQRLRITAEGPEFRCGDFAVRVGGLFLNSNGSGTLVEVEYLPCTRAGMGESALREFIFALLDGETAAVIEDTAPRAEGLPLSFGRGHAAMQFVRLLRTTRLVQLAPDTAAARAELERNYNRRFGLAAAERAEDKAAAPDGGVRVGGTVSEATVSVEGLAHPVRILVAGPEHAARRVLLLHGYGSDAHEWRVVGALDALAAMGVRAIAPDLPVLCRHMRTMLAPKELGGVAGATAGSAEPDASVDGVRSDSVPIDRRLFLSRLVSALGWGSSKLVVVAASAAGSYATPFVLSPQHFRSIAGYVSVAATFSRETYVPPTMADRKRKRAGAEATPALLVWGTLDNAFPPVSLAAQAQARFFRRTKWMLLPGAAHECHVHTPDLFCRCLVEFVSGNNSSAKGIRQGQAESAVQMVVADWSEASDAKA
eukprot:scaffold69855_cov27-Tisochrysis_lutea.AAC.6